MFRNRSLIEGDVIAGRYKRFSSEIRTILGKLSSAINKIRKGRTRGYEGGKGGNTGARLK
jgi:hypothetical protein